MKKLIMILVVGVAACATQPIPQPVEDRVAAWGPGDARTAEAIHDLNARDRRNLTPLDQR